MRRALLLAGAIALSACDNQSGFTQADKAGCDRSAVELTFVKQDNGAVLVEQKPGPMWEACTKMGWTPPASVDLKK